MKAFLKQHWFIVALCAVFAVVSAGLIVTWYRYQLNPDATAYISIARKYAHGDFRHAINGYWGPLLSWLIVPGIWLHIEPIVVAKLIAAGASLGLLIIVYRFLSDRNVRPLIIWISCLCLGSLLLEWVTVEAITPDLILSLLIVLFAVRLADFVKKPSRNAAMVLGALGALMYFAKGFGFFLFIATVALVAGWQWLHVDKNIGAVARRYAPLAIVFAVLVLPFIGLISVKYHKLTINNAGAYDHHIHGYYGAKTADMEPIIATAGPLTPTNSTAVNAWEDPTPLTYKVPGWSPFDSKAHLSYFLFGTVGKNINNIIRYVYDEGPFILLGIMALAIGWWQRKQQRHFAIFALVAVLMLGGYCLVLSEGRYMWPAFVMGTMAGGLWVGMLVQRGLLNRVQIATGGAILIALAALNTGQILAKTPYINRDTFHISQQLSPIIPSGSNVLSDYFDGSYRVCYYMHLHCYNVLDPPTNNASNYYSLLVKEHITYLIDFHTKDSHPEYMSFVHKYYTEVDDRIVDGQHVSVYKLKGL